MMAGIINWNEMWKVMMSGDYRRRAHEEDAGKKLERAKKLIPKTYNLKSKGGESVK